MKKLLLSFSILILSISTFSQGFAPIGATWHYTEGFFGNGRIDYEKIESVKDTLIQNKLCKKLVKRHGIINYYQPLGDLFMYSNADTVFMYEPFSQNFQAIYIFSAPANSSYSFYIQPDPMFSSVPFLLDTVRVSIDSVGTLVKQNQSYTVQFVTYDIFYGNKSFQSSVTYNSEIISGMGDKYYLTNFFAYRSMVIDGNYSGGIRCYQDSIVGLKKFQADSCNHTSGSTGITGNKVLEYSFYPNPAEDFIRIDGIKTNGNKFQLFSTTGLLVSEGALESKINLSNLPSGIYLFNIVNVRGEIFQSEKLLKR